MSRVIPGKAPMSSEELACRDTRLGKVLFTHSHGLSCGMLLQGERLLALEFFSGAESLLNGIYIGRVRDVAAHLDACFVEIAKGTVCHLAFKDAKEPILTNRTYDGRLLQGDEILVRVIRDAQKTKQPSVTARFDRQKDADVIAGAMHRTCFTCIRPPKAPWQIFLTESLSPDEYTEIVTDDTALCAELQRFLAEGNCPGKSVRLYEDTAFPLALLYGLEAKIDTALNRRIWLRSGAYLVIEPTEAMTVIDVNSGKRQHRRSDPDYYLEINKEAMDEIALQLRLRNLSGMIMVDFISMPNRELKEELLAYARACFSGSLVKTLAIDITPLGILEITRQKKSRPVREQLKNRKDIEKIEKEETAYGTDQV